MGQSESLHTIVLILSVANVVCPLVFGFVMWKMSQIFVSKSQFEELKLALSEETADTKLWRRQIDMDISELLQRTADKR